MILLIVLGSILLWYAIGVAGFVFWWTSDYDLTSDELPMALFAGVSGPFSWIIGATIHCDLNRTLVRKRK